MLISVCIPCYRSTETLPVVVEEIRKEFESREGYEYQLVLVNDGSPDDTFETIKQLCKEDSNITGVNLSRNQGQASAKLAAVKYATGDALVYMDDDGQHPASGIFDLVEKINEGYDVAYARFQNKKHSIFKRVTSKLHRTIAEIFATKPKGIYTSSFIAWSRLCMDAIKDYHSPFPSAGAYLQSYTDKFINVDIEHRQRVAGSSGYNLKRLFSLWLNSFTNFSIVPLRIASFCGSMCACLGFLGGLIIIIRKLLHPTMAAGYASTIAVILFIGGMIMMMLGLMGEYIGRMYMTLSNKPQYTISNVINEKEESV